MNWRLEFHLHWPHDRCALGWQYIGPSEEENIHTFTLYLTILTITLDIFPGE